MACDLVVVLAISLARAERILCILDRRNAAAVTLGIPKTTVAEHMLAVMRFGTEFDVFCDAFLRRRDLNWFRCVGFDTGGERSGGVTVATELGRNGQVRLRTPPFTNESESTRQRCSEIP